MKVIISKNFKDKYTGLRHVKGSILEDLEPSRVNELVEKDAARVKMTKQELTKELTDRNIEFEDSAKVNELIDLLLASK